MSLQLFAVCDIIFSAELIGKAAARAYILPTRGADIL